MKSVISWLKSLSSSDHRKTQRQKSPLLAVYYWNGDAAPVAHEIRDISSTGFYLLTTERWHLGTLITMTLQRTDIAYPKSDGEHYIAVLSKVVRLGEDGVGFAFVPLETHSSGQAALKSNLVGTRALSNFLEQLKQDQGHLVVGCRAGTLGEDHRRGGNRTRQSRERTI